MEVADRKNKKDADGWGAKDPAREVRVYALLAEQEARTNRGSLAMKHSVPSVGRK